MTLYVSWIILAGVCTRPPSQKPTSTDSCSPSSSRQQPATGETGPAPRSSPVSAWAASKPPCPST
jgi:hypothetical protein